MFVNEYWVAYNKHISIFGKCRVLTDKETPTLAKGLSGIYRVTVANHAIAHG
jgi:hypothetical protein